MTSTLVSAPPAVYTINDFCAAHGRMSRTHFYELLKQGKGPRVFKAGARTYVSAQAAQAWVTQMEAASNSTQHQGG